MGRFSSTNCIVPLDPFVEYEDAVQPLTSEYLDKLREVSYDKKVLPVQRIGVQARRPFSPTAAGWESRIRSIDESMSFQVYLERITFIPTNRESVRFLLRQPSYLPPYGVEFGDCRVKLSGFYRNAQRFEVTSRLSSARIYLDGTFSTRVQQGVFTTNTRVLPERL